METFDLASLILILIVAIVLFLLLRAVNLWYWKINRRIELQEETNALLRKLVEQEVKKEFKSSDPNFTSTEQTSLNDPKVLENLLKNLGEKE